MRVEDIINALHLYPHLNLGSDHDHLGSIGSAPSRGTRKALQVEDNGHFSTSVLLAFLAILVASLWMLCHCFT